MFMLSRKIYKNCHAITHALTNANTHIYPLFSFINENPKNEQQQQKKLIIYRNRMGAKKKYRKEE